MLRCSFAQRTRILTKYESHIESYTLCFLAEGRASFASSGLLETNKTMCSCVLI